MVALVVLYSLFTREHLTTFQRWCLAAVVGGGLGNNFDRIFRPGGVVDFVQMRVFGLFGMEFWPVYNLADTTLVVSGILLVISFLLPQKKTTGPRLPEEHREQEPQARAVPARRDASFNIVLMFIFIIAIFLVASRFLGDTPNPVVYQIVLFVGFIASIVLTFLIYGKVMKWLQAKYNLEQHFPQLFKKKK